MRLKHHTQCNESTILPANHFYENGDVLYADGKTAKEVFEDSLLPSKPPIIDPEPEAKAIADSAIVDVHVATSDEVKEPKRKTKKKTEE